MSFFARGLLSVALAASGAAVSAGRTVPLDVAFTLEPGESALIADTPLKVTFEAVTSDSRCPKGVACVWEGDAAVAVILELPPAAGEPRTLHTSAREQRETRYEGFVLSLVGLDPQPVEGRPIAPGDYRATFVVSRNR